MRSFIKNKKLPPSKIKIEIHIPNSVAPLCGMTRTYIFDQNKEEELKISDIINMELSAKNIKLKWVKG